MPIQTRKSVTRRSRSMKAAPSRRAKMKTRARLAVSAEKPATRGRKKKTVARVKKTTKMSALGW